MIVSTSVLAEDKATVKHEILPVELFAAHSQFRQMTLSPDGKHIAFTYEENNNEVKVAIITSDMKKISSSFGFGENQHLGSPFWVNNNRVITTLVKNTGWLDDTKSNVIYLGVNVDGKNRRSLIDNSNSIAYSGYRYLNDLPRDPEHILVAKYHFTDKGGLKLQKMNVNNGKISYLDAIPNTTDDGKIVDVQVDTNDEVRIALENDDGKNEFDPDDDILTLHYKNSDGWQSTKIPSNRAHANFDFLGFNRENSKFYFISNMDMPKNDTKGVFSFDFETQKIELVFRHDDVDVLGGIFGPKGEILGVGYMPGYSQKYFFDENNKEVQLIKALEASFKGQSVSITSYTADANQAIVFVRSDKNPGDFYLYDRNKGKLRYLASPMPKINPKQMAPMEAFTVLSRDGVKLYGYITLPTNKPPKDLPLIVNPHGGPHGPFDTWGFNPQAQLYANNGYAVMQINFRGSGGYGTDFEESGYGKWGREMQDDVTDATLWAVKQGLADRNRICIMGGSYGGYATLQGLVREPDLYKCGIGIAGVYSLPMMWEKGDMHSSRSQDYSEVFLNKFIGKDEATLKKYSPAYNVDKIKAGIFLIHGSNDVRVPIEHAELLEKNLDAIGKPYESLVRAEGHGFTQEKNRIDQFHQVLKFLEKYIGK